MAPDVLPAYTCQVGYAGKLGDFNKGSWATYDPAVHVGAMAKFIVSPEEDATAKLVMLVGWAKKGDALHDDTGNG